jgi:purine nucleosidase
MTRCNRFALAFLWVLLASSSGWTQQRRKVIINQDGSGPGGSNMQTLALLIQSPQVEVLGITVVSGNQWRDEEVAHTLRLLEIMGRTDIPVVPGAVAVKTQLYMDIDVDHRATYGKTISWDSAAQVSSYLRLANVQFDIDAQRFYKIHIDLMTRPARGSRPSP